ncbi:hypothetical protein MASR2M29_15770 [Spirochaetota bacterium]
MAFTTAASMFRSLPFIRNNIKARGSPGNTEKSVDQNEKRRLVFITNHRLLSPPTMRATALLNALTKTYFL